MTSFHIFLMLLTAAAWGFNFVVTRVTLEVFTSGQLALARTVITLVLLLPWWQPWRGVSFRHLVAGLAIGVISFYAIYEAIRMTDSLTTVAIGTQLMAPVSAVIALVFYRERITRRRWLGILLATAGAIVLAGATGFGVSAIALGLTVLSVIAYSAGSIVVSKIGGVGIWRLLAWISAVSTIPLGMIAAHSGPLFPNPSTLHLVHWLSLAYSSAVSSILGQAVLFSMYRIYPVSEVASWMLFVPVFAACSSVLVYHEQIEFSVAFGGAVILLGVWIQQSRKGATFPVG